MFFCIRPLPQVIKFSMNCRSNFGLILASIFLDFHDFFGIDFRIDFLSIFDRKWLPKWSGVIHLRRPRERPFRDLVFGTLQGVPPRRIWWPFGDLLATFWWHFGLPKLPKWTPARTILGEFYIISWWFSWCSAVCLSCLLFSLLLRLCYFIPRWFSSCLLPSNLRTF